MNRREARSEARKRIQTTKMIDHESSEKMTRMARTDFPTHPLCSNAVQSCTARYGSKCTSATPTRQPPTETAASGDAAFHFDVHAAGDQLVGLEVEPEVFVPHRIEKPSVAAATRAEIGAAVRFDPENFAPEVLRQGGQCGQKIRGRLSPVDDHATDV